MFSGPPYAGATVGLGTRHGKEEQLGPPFARVLGARVRTPPGLDTDRFGAFTGEVPRTLAPLAAARGKARLAMQATGLPLGLASEASYGPLPSVGVPGHEELLVFLDDEMGIEVVEVARSLSTPGGALRTRSADDDVVERYLAGLGWPEQAVVVVPAQGDRAPGVAEGVGAATGAATAKGVTDRERLAAAVETAARASADGHALLQPDLRAHRCPSRRAVLADLGTALANRLATRCPGCAAPGWGRVDAERGLPCGHCGARTDLVRADVHGCARCAHRAVLPRGQDRADPRWCPVCNP